MFNTLMYVFQVCLCTFNTYQIVDGNKSSITALVFTGMAALVFLVLIAKENNTTQ